MRKSNKKESKEKRERLKSEKRKSKTDIKKQLSTNKLDMSVIPEENEVVVTEEEKGRIVGLDIAS